MKYPQRKLLKPLNTFDPKAESCSGLMEKLLKEQKHPSKNLPKE
jgi:hypothetical protein